MEFRNAIHTKPGPERRRRALLVAALAARRVRNIDAPELRHVHTLPRLLARHRLERGGHGAAGVPGQPWRAWTQKFCAGREAQRTTIVVDPNDWRIAGEDMEWCRGLVFKWSQWAPTPTISYKPDGTTEPAVWGHDHCEFCWRDFSDTDYDCGDGSRALTEGWAARGPAGRPEGQRRDDYHWVCPTCFEDFKDYFGWTVRS